MIKDDIDGLRTVVRELYKRYSYRQIADMVGVGYSTIYRFCLGNNIHPDLLHDLEKGVERLEKNN